MGLLPVIGSIAGGLIQANAAKSAARTQARAATQAGDLMDKAAKEASGYQIAGIDRSEGLQTGAVRDATGATITGNQQVANALSGGLTTGAGHMVDAYGRVINLSDQTLAEQRGMYQPYIDAGGAATGAYAYELGVGDRPDGYAGYEQTPGFQFALQRANDSIEGSAAASGGLFSGSTLRALSDNTVGMAQQEHGNHLARLAGVSGQGLTATNALSGDLGTHLGIVGDATLGIGQTNANLATGLGDVQAQHAAADADAWAKQYLGLGQIGGAAAIDRANSQATAATAGAEARAAALAQSGQAKAAGQVATGNALAGIGDNLMSLWGFSQGLNSGGADDKAAGKAAGGNAFSWW